MPPSDDTPARVRWARLRFQIIGTLLASPPDEGELRLRLTELAARPWAHPTTGEVVRFSFKTIERWFYAARGATDPIAILARRVPSHAGTHPRISDVLAEAIARLYRDHPRWSFRGSTTTTSRRVAREDPRLALDAPYATVRRYMRQQGRCVLETSGTARVTRPSCHARRARTRSRTSTASGTSTSTRGSRAPSSPRPDKVEEASAPRHPRRSLAALLPPAVVHRRDRRITGARPLAGLPQTRPAPARCSSRQRRRHARRRDRGAARASRHRSSHDASVFARSKNGKQGCPFWGQIGKAACSRCSKASSGARPRDAQHRAPGMGVEHEYHRKEHSEIKETPLARYLRGPRRRS